MKAFVNFPCWRAEEPEHFVRTEALQGHRATFLAVHLPIQGFVTVIGALPQHTERAVLEALVPRRHAIVLVEGEPGSGKSHLIRWLEVSWPNPDKRDYPVLVPRSDGSLLGTLERLRQRLGPTFAAPLVGLGRVDQLAQQGRAQAFLGQLVTLCQSASYAAEPPLHAEWLDRSEAWKLLNHNALRAEWSAPEEIVRLLGGAEGKRDQQMVRFKPAHIADLVRIIRGSTARVMGFRVQQLFVQLQNEFPLVQEVLQATDDVDLQYERLAGTAPSTVKLLEALNARREDAIQGLLGIQRNELQGKFLEVRRLLGKAGLRLVLLLEDITNLQGVDRQLIEALLPNVQAEEHADLCELVAVLGVTPGYYHDAFSGLGNVRDRLYLHLRLTHSETQGLAKTEATFLREPESRLRFSATYLNATRLGRAEVEKWARRGTEQERPNACASCPFRAPCHAAFGAVEVQGIGEGAVGLYPLSKHAAEQMWEQLRDPEAKRSLKTPRGLLINVISPALNGHQALREGRFPTDEVENVNLERLSPGPDVVDLLAQVAPEDRERLRRAIVWWGERSSGVVQTRTEGDFYSGVPRTVMGAFALPWPSQGVVPPALATDSAGGQPAVPPPGVSPPPPPPPSPSPAPKPSVGTTVAPVQPATAPAADPGAELPGEWKTRLQGLDRWREGERPADAATWETLLVGLLSNISPGDIGCSRKLWDTLFTKENVTLEGAKARMTSLQFVMPRVGEVHRGLTALVWLQHGRNLDRATSSRRFAEFAAFQGWLLEQAKAHYDQGLASVRKELGGDPVRLVVRALVTGGWLTGTAPVEGSAHEVWTRTLASQPPPQESRSGLWSKLVHDFDHWRPYLLDLLGDWAQVGQESRDVGLVDPAQVYEAVRTAPGELERWPEGKGHFIGGLAQLKQLHELMQKFRANLVPSVREEERQLQGRAAQVMETTGGKDAEAFLSQVNDMLTALLDIDRLLVSAANWSQWGQAWKSLEKAGLVGENKERIRMLDDAIWTLKDEARDADVLEALRRARSLNSADLKLVHEAVEQAARAITSAHGMARGWVAPTSGEAGSLDVLRRAAKRIAAAGAAVRDACGGRHG
ncbi:hypothetical protein F0U62_21395 [Cystobacter fuscus]|uniref:hypothetical protein n=1 Tax=Cystobacter fuscus TaxID=43 RepID=UPI002B280AC2|nr:hypothetical protein F0U62_21395 [Cystobacter fuscus]